MEERAHHGPSYKSYLAVFGGLLALTALTVFLSYAGLSPDTQHALAFVIATVKTLLVAAIFMHLRYEKRLLSWFGVVPVLLALLFIFAISPDIGVDRP